MLSANEAELPAPIRAEFSHSGHTLVTYHWPAPGKPRVLLLHGIGMGHSVYDSFVQALRAGTTPPFDVTTVDLPGFGEAPTPAEALSIEHTADLVALQLASTAQTTPLILVGHSMGSQVAAEVAARHPNLVHRLVLVGVTVNPDERTAAKQAARMVQDLGGERLSVLLKGAVAYAQAGPAWFVEKLGPTLAHRIERALPKIGCPTMVLRGSTDRVSPRAFGELVVSLVPDATLVELPGHGHEAIIADGEPAVQAIRTWLAQTSLRG